MTNDTIDPSIAAKCSEIKALPYARYIVAEDVIERNFGYKIIRQQVSTGRNSLIYKCEHAKHPEVYCVVKAYKMGKDKVRASFREETSQIMRFVSGKSPLVISTYDMFYTSEKLYLMCDWSARGEVLANLKQHSIKLNEEMLRNWTLDMLNAVQFLHNNAICHRNMAPSCLLLTQDNRVKIGTLSDAVIYCKPEGGLIKQKWPKFSRTANWNQPPEVAKGKPYDPRRAEIWSIGATVYWFITRAHPIDYKSPSRVTKQLEHRFGYMRKVTNRCQNFVKKMLAFQPHSRPTVSQALQMEWLTLAPSTSPGATKEAEITVSEKAPVEPGDATGPEETAAPEVSQAPAETSRKETTTPEAGGGAENNNTPE